MSDVGTPPAAGTRTARVKAWMSTHKPVVAGGAAAAGVGAFALHRRNAAGGGSSASSATTPAASGNVAGLSGNPADYQAQLETWLQQAINDQNATIRKSLRQRNRPTGPKAPTPAPRPGAGRYTIRKGDTLAKIAAYTLGEDTARHVLAIKRANPILAPFPKNARLDWLAGDTLHIPRAAHDPVPGHVYAAAPKPKPPRKPQPRPRPIRRRRRRGQQYHPGAAG